MLSETNALIFALLSGIVPALFWLWFWIREDRLRPEPKSALLSAFIGGIIAVLMALFFEMIIYYLLVDANSNSLKDFPNFVLIPIQNLAEKYNLSAIQAVFWENIKVALINTNIDIKKFLLVVIIAPVTEELLKLFLSYNICLRRKVNDEPIDASIYMLTTALGFAAVETALILAEPYSHGRILDSFIAGNFRSIGPMLIHLISSAMIGIFIGLAFYKSKIYKIFYTFLGLILAIIMHSGFNFFIVLNDTTHNTTYFWIACLGTWLLVVALLISFERVKKVKHPTLISSRRIIPRSF